MDEKFNEATKNRPAGDRLLDSPVVLMDIPTFIKQLRNEKAWEENDRNSITVFKTGKMRRNRSLAQKCGNDYRTSRQCVEPADN